MSCLTRSSENLKLLSSINQCVAEPVSGAYYSGERSGCPIIRPWTNHRLWRCPTTNHRPRTRSLLQRCLRKRPLEPMVDYQWMVLRSSETIVGEETCMCKNSFGYCKRGSPCNLDKRRFFSGDERFFLTLAH